MPAYRSHGSHITATTTTTTRGCKGGQRGRAAAGSLPWHNNAAEERPHNHDDAYDDDDDDDNALSQIFNELNNVLLLRQPQQGSPHEGHVLQLPLPLAAVCFGCSIVCVWGIPQLVSGILTCLLAFYALSEVGLITTCHFA